MCVIYKYTCIYMYIYVYRARESFCVYTYIYKSPQAKTRHQVNTGLLFWPGGICMQPCVGVVPCFGLRGFVCNPVLTWCLVLA